MPEGRARIPACNMLSSSRSGSGGCAGLGLHTRPRADVTKPYRIRFAFPIGILLAALTVSCGGDVTFPDQGEAARLEIADGNEQQAAAGAELGDPVIVRVLDTEGRPVPGADVDFVVADGGGAVEPETVETGTDGRASATWTLGPGAGHQQLVAPPPRGATTTMLVW